jgi:Linalool dehydratase/isomerase
VPRMRSLASLTLALALASRAFAGEAPRGLSDAELGHQQEFVKLAFQDLDDWSDWEGADQRGMEAYRYQAAFMAYTLALQQYLSVPAYRELHQRTIARLIERILQKPVWDYWEVVSQGKDWYDPDFAGPLPAVRDPVRDRNIMYSGHLVHMAALYEMLYRDMRWDRPGAFTFRWSADEAYVYDLPTLITRIRDEMAAGPGGVQCEPNLIFPECNQHPILAFKLFDPLHGTDLYATRTHFAKLFASAPMVDPATHEVVAFYRVKQHDVLGDLNPTVGMPADLAVWPLTKLGVMSFDSPSACGWTGTFMHGWDRETVERHYPHQREDHVVRDASGAHLRNDLSAQLSVGHFAALAVEVGDEETANALIETADALYRPEWHEGRLVYPLRAKPDESWRDTLIRWATWDQGGLTTHLTDKLLALARSNRPNGVWKLHNEPWTDADFTYPLVGSVDFPRVLVRRAYWDAERETLHVTLVPGFGAPPSTRFRVTGLDPKRTWAVAGDGGALDSRAAAPGTLEITVALGSERELTVSPAERKVAKLGDGGR